MIGYPSMELEVDCIRASCRNRFSNLSDDELIEIYRRAEERFGNKRILILIFQPKEFFEGAAAIDILRERHGDNYVENLTGVPQAKTILQKILDLDF